MPTGIKNVLFTTTTSEHLTSAVCSVDDDDDGRTTALGAELYCTVSGAELVWICFLRAALYFSAVTRKKRHLGSVHRYKVLDVSLSACDGKQTRQHSVSLPRDYRLNWQMK